MQLISKCLTAREARTVQEVTFVVVNNFVSFGSVSVPWVLLMLFLGVEVEGLAWFVLW